jgi:hypothetical protein
MPKFTSKFALATVISVLLLTSGVSVSNADDSAGYLSSYVDAPAVQNSYVNGTLMNFDQGCPLEWPGIGTTDVACTPTTANVFGGASSELAAPVRGGEGTGFATVWPGSPMTLTLTEPATYLGLWWSAGDGTNLMQFYSGDTLVGTFSFDALMGALSNQNLDSTSGNQYTVADYFGNPVDGGDSGEPFAYLHVFAAAGKSFDKVVFTESGGGGFEFDNLMIAKGTNETATTLVHVDGPVEVITPTPDPTISYKPSPTPSKAALAETGNSSNPWNLGLIASLMLILGVGVIRIAGRKRQN